VPLVELLLLLLFLLRTALLHRGCRPHQRMRLLRTRSALLRLRWTELAVHGLRVAILGHLRVPVFGLRSSLLLVDPWLRLRHLADLVIPCVLRTKRFEAFL